MIAVLSQKHQEIDALCEEFGVRQLEIFGSAADENRFNPHRSDIDFIVEFHPDQPMGPWLATFFGLREALSNLLGYPVDLVMASAMKNPYFIREANRTRKLLYGPQEPQVA